MCSSNVAKHHEPILGRVCRAVQLASRSCWPSLPIAAGREAVRARVSPRARRSAVPLSSAAVFRSSSGVCVALLVVITVLPLVGGGAIN